MRANLRVEHNPLFFFDLALVRLVPGVALATRANFGRDPALREPFVLAFQAMAGRYVLFLGRLHSRISDDF